MSSPKEKSIGNHIVILYTKILEVYLFAFAFRLFHEDFSSIDAADAVSPSIEEVSMKQSEGKCKQINF